MQKPSLYLSDYFERNRSAYIDGLMRVRTANDLNHWVRFFLGGILETASKGRETFQSILKLQRDAESAAMAQGRRARTASATLNFMFKRPIFGTKDIVRGVRVSQPTAEATIQAFVKAGLLVEMTGQRRNRLFAFQPYIRLFAI